MVRTLRMSGGVRRTPTPPTPPNTPSQNPFDVDVTFEEFVLFLRTPLGRRYMRYYLRAIFE